MRQQQGFLLVASAVLLTLVAFLVTGVAYFTINNAASTSNIFESTEAFYLAEAGLERGLLAIANNTPASRVACATVNGAGVYSQILPDVITPVGSFTVTGTSYNVATATLTADITATDLIIPASTVAGYAPSGGIFIGGEIIRYGGKGTTSAQCGGASNCFLVAKRATGGTYATAHSATRPISQNLCYLASTGNVPATSPLATRTVSRVAMYARDTNIWVVGNSDASGEVILNWSGEVWTREPVGTVSNSNLNAVFINSASDGWAGGNTLAGTCPAAPASTGVFGRFTGTWAQACSVATVINQSILGMHCFSTTLCKAGAVTDGTTAIIARYDPPAPTGWARDTVTTTGAQANRVRAVDVNDVYVVSATLGFAVGNNWPAPGTQPGEMIFNWDGTTWRRSTAQASIADQNFYGIHCPTATRCWAVGAAGSIATKSGAGTVFSGPAGASPFTVNASVTGLTLRDVFCMSATDCWAVGDASGGNATFVRLTGTTWTRDTTNIDDSITPTVNLDSVYCDTASHCWAVGDTYVFYWDGTVWLDWSGGVVNAASPLTVNEVALSAPLPSAPVITNTMRLFQWEEVTN